MHFTLVRPRTNLFFVLFTLIRPSICLITSLKSAHGILTLSFLDPPAPKIPCEFTAAGSWMFEDKRIWRWWSKVPPGSPNC